MDHPKSVTCYKRQGRSSEASLCGLPSSLKWNWTCWSEGFRGDGREWSCSVAFGERCFSLSGILWGRGILVPMICSGGQRQGVDRRAGEGQRELASQATSEAPSLLYFKASSRSKYCASRCFVLFYFFPLCPNITKARGQIIIFRK